MNVSVKKENIGEIWVLLKAEKKRLEDKGANKKNKKVR